MSFPRYAKYKDSGVEWLGEVPEHWEIRTLSSLSTKITNGYVGPTRDILTNDGTRYLQSLHIKGNRIRFDNPYFVDEEWSKSHGKSILETGDILIVQTGDIGQVAVVTEEFAGCNCHALIIVAPLRQATYGEWISWVLNSDYGFHSLLSIQTGALHPHLNCGNVKNVLIPLPKREEQSVIMAFIEAETAKIDALVVEQQRLIELLKEKRQAVISHAVTKGLNPDAPMKPSGIEWLGDVPEHWDVCQLKRAFSSVDYGISDSLEAEGAIAILRMGNIENGKIVTDDLKYIDSVDDTLLLQQGDLLYNRTNSLDLIGKVGLFQGNPATPMSFASYLVRLRTVDRSISSYFAYLLNTEGILGIARSHAFVSIGQCNLNPTRYGQITVAIPPKTEQVGIVAHLDDETAKLDALTVEAQRTIDLLQERRTALISAAVTGKIDVRGLAESEAA